MADQAQSDAKRPERSPLLQLIRPCANHRDARVRGRQHFIEQSRLAQSGFAFDEDDPATTARRLVDHARDDRKFARTPYDRQPLGSHRREPTATGESQRTNSNLVINPTRSSTAASWQPGRRPKRCGYFRAQARREVTGAANAPNCPRRSRHVATGIASILHRPNRLMALTCAFSERAVHRAESRSFVPCPAVLSGRFRRSRNRPDQMS